MNSTLLNKIHGNFYFVVGATLKILNIDKIVRSKNESPSVYFIKKKSSLEDKLRRAINKSRYV